MGFLNFVLENLWTVLLCFTTGYLFYRTIVKTKKKSYLEDAGIPYFSPPPLIAMLIPVFFKINFHDMELKKYKQCGRLYGTAEGGRPTLSIAEPELIKKILVKDFHAFNSRRTFTSGDPVADNIISLVNGEKWKRIRTIITPTFSSRKIKKMADIIFDSSKSLVKNLLSSPGNPISAKETYSAFTMDVIASTAFGTKLNSFEDPNNQFVQAAKPVFQGNLTLNIILHLALPSLASFLKLSTFNKKAMTFFKKLTLEIIEHRKKTGQVKNDFLQLLLDAEKEYETGKYETKDSEKNIDDINAEELGHDEDNENMFKPTKAYRALSQNELLAQCVIFFLAGYETTATALSMASYLLAENPEVQEKLKEEVDSVIEKHGGKLSYNAIQEMKYLDNVVNETLRMYPPAVRLERLATEDYELEGTGITIKKDTLITVPVHCMHNDPEFYPEPDKFRPERFSPEEKASRHPYSYLTFGAGPRNCVAMRFALMEVKLCLAYVISKVKLLRYLGPQDSAIFESQRGLITPKVKFMVEKRTDTLLQD